MALPERFGRYRVTAPLGSGAMGAVYRARDELLHRDVAVKVVRPFVGAGLAAQLFRERFLNEARAVAALAHPNVVRVFDMGFEDDVPFLVMELAEGPSLKDRIASGGRLDAAALGALGVQVARALQTAHARGILHRDVKPANILEAEPGVWKLADFGVAHVPSSELTITGQFVGSPAYAAPEALERGEFSAASDVYGLGATLYEAATGAPPRGERSRVSLIATSDGSVVPLTTARADLPPALAAAIMRALAKDPAERPGAEAFADALAGGEPGRASPSAAAVTATATRNRRIAAALGVFTVALAIAVIADDCGGRRAVGPIAAPVGAPVAGRSVDERWTRIREAIHDEDFKSAEKQLEHLLESGDGGEDAEELLDWVREQRKERKKWKRR